MTLADFADSCKRLADFKKKVMNKTFKVNSNTSSHSYGQSITIVPGTQFNWSAKIISYGATTESGTSGNQISFAEIDFGLETISDFNDELVRKTQELIDLQESISLLKDRIDFMKSNNLEKIDEELWKANRIVEVMKDPTIQEMDKVAMVAKFLKN